MRFIKSFIFYIIVLGLPLWVIGFAIFLLYVFSFKFLEVPSHTDALVALTGGEYRVQTAIDLLAQDKADKLLITGVNQKISPNSVLAHAPKQILDRITLGYKATTTKENALETQEWLLRKRIRTAILVTSFYHMPRAYLEISEKAPDVTFSFYPIWPKQFDQSMDWIYTRSAWQLFLEYNKVLCVLGTRYIERFK